MKLLRESCLALFLLCIHMEDSRKHSSHWANTTEFWDAPWLLAWLKSTFHSLRPAPEEVLSPRNGGSYYFSETLIGLQREYSDCWLGKITMWWPQQAVLVWENRKPVNSQAAFCNQAAVPAEGGSELHSSSAGEHLAQPSTDLSQDLAIGAAQPFLSSLWAGGQTPQWKTSADLQSRHGSLSSAVPMHCCATGSRHSLLSFLMDGSEPYSGARSSNTWVLGTSPLPHCMGHFAS